MFKMNVLLTFVGVVVCTFSAHLPSEIPRCKLSDPKLKECLKSSTAIAINVFPNGNKNLRMPSLDPIRLKEVIIEPQPGPINIFQKYTDVVLLGISNVIINNIEIRLDDCNLLLEYTLPLLTAEANYEIKGQLLLLAVDAKGKLTSEAENFRTNVTAKCEKFEKDGAVHLKIVSTEVSFILSNIKFDFGNLIGGNPQLDEEVHKIIDDNPLEFFEVMKPSCEAMWKASLMNMMNIIFTQIPLNELFEDY